jgi:single-strand DNA-binding protein
MNINTVILYGNLTRDPELRALPSGMNVCSFSIATNRTYTGKDGKKQDQVDFHNIVVFGRTADNVAQYMKKGNGVFIEGRLQTRSWEKDGQKQYRTEVVAERVQFGPKTSGGSGGYSGGAAGGAARDKVKDDAGSAGGAGIEYPKDTINPEDIPF